MTNTYLIENNKKANDIDDIVSLFKEKKVKLIKYN